MDVDEDINMVYDFELGDQAVDVDIRELVDFLPTSAVDLSLDSTASDTGESSADISASQGSVAFFEQSTLVVSIVDGNVITAGPWVKDKDKSVF